MFSSINKSIKTPNKKYNLNVLIPFFNSLNFHSKKELDYQDWKTILLFKEKGLHYTDEGREVIYLILKQMNNYKLSTNKSSNKETIDRVYLQEKINKLLSKPSNFEIKEDGKILIKSLDRYYYNNTKPVSIEL